MSKLKPCPFCGSSDLLTEPNYDDSTVRCQSCNAEGPTGNYQGCENKWNDHKEQSMNNAFIVVGFIDYEGSNQLFASLDRTTANSRCKLLEDANKVDYLNNPHLDKGECYDSFEVIEVELI